MLPTMWSTRLFLMFGGCDQAPPCAPIGEVQLLTLEIAAEGAAPTYVDLPIGHGLRPTLPAPVRRVYWRNPSGRAEQLFVYQIEETRAHAPGGTEPYVVIPPMQFVELKPVTPPYTLVFVAALAETDRDAALAAVGDGRQSNQGACRDTLVLAVEVEP